MRERIGIKAKDWIELFRNFTISNNKNPKIADNDKASKEYIRKATEISESDRKQLEKVLADIEKKADKLEKQRNERNKKTTRRQSDEIKYNNKEENKKEINKEGRERE